MRSASGASTSDGILALLAIVTAERLRRTAAKP
jgi:MYXO-CTERM domain-containing protein